jgi:hypothetical protein
MNPSPLSVSRRAAISSLVAGSALFKGLAAELVHGGNTAMGTDPLLPRPAHFAPRARSVIFLNMSGGVSHVDSFDHKPRLFEDHGKTYQVPQIMLQAFAANNRAAAKFFKRPDWNFAQHGRSGLWISDMFPYVAQCADELCVINSMRNSHADHFQATLGMHTGSVTFPRPSIGAWISYGLGTLNQNLPSFVVIAPNLPYAGTQVWSSDFLPGCHQGTLVSPGQEPIPNIRPRQSKGALQRIELDFAQAANREHAAVRGGDPLLDARIQSFETAFGMQIEGPEALDISKESDETLRLYGLERGSTKGFAWQCIAARRLIERGVRFVELIDTGAGGNWDSHGNMADHGRLALNVDRPIAALLRDMRSRGLLDETLVVWTTEFGRTPFNSAKDAKGREHHAESFSTWMAGAGVKPGMNYGSSDEHGCAVAENEVHIHDFHATILHLMGLNHEALTFRHAGRDFRLTDVAGNVVRDILA